MTTTLLDLGASVNLLPYYLYKQIGLQEMQPTKMMLQLADRSIKYPKGMVENVLVKVQDFYYPADFVILDTEVANDSVPIILGCPFLATANALINCRDGSMSLSFGHLSVEVNVFKLLKQLPDSSTDEEVSMIECLAQDYFNNTFPENHMHKFLSFGSLDFVDDSYIEEVNTIFESTQIVDPSVAPYTEFEDMLPKQVFITQDEDPPEEFIDIPPTPVLKPLPPELKYIQLDPDSSHPIIISLHQNLRKRTHP